jgi:aldehyde:ferredoxin oxidoreductase
MTRARKIALVDLGRCEVETFPVPMDLEQRFLGGSGVATWLFCKFAPKMVDPGSADNIIIVSAGLLSGTLSAPLGSAVLTTKSPVTGLLTRVCTDGPFAAQMRRAGFEHIVLKGQAKKEICLLIRDGRIEFKEVHGLKDKDLSDDQRPTLSKEGLAAKNIVALACEGSVPLEVKDPEGIIALEKKCLESRDEPVAHNDQNSEIQDMEIMDGPAGSVDMTQIKQTLVQCLGLPSGSTNGANGCELDFETAAKRIAFNTGLELDKDELKQIAYRCIAMERIYNIREGIASKKGQPADEYRENGWTRKAVLKKAKVFDPLLIDDLWSRLK